MDALSIWTIYDHPRDYPNTYVARQFVVKHDGTAAATDNVVLAPTLDVLRSAMIEMGLTVITRSEGDDPKIVEVWL